MSPETLAIFALLDPSSGAAELPDQPRISMHLTGDETPTSRCWSTPDIPTCATTHLLVADPIVELVNSAINHVTTFAVLPGDEEADAIVDRLLERRPRTKRKLKKR